MYFLHELLTRLGCLMQEQGLSLCTKKIRRYNCNSTLNIQSQREETRIATAQFISYNCITTPAANYMKGTDTAWPSVHRQYFQGQFKRTEHEFCISKFNKATGIKETWGHDTKPHMSSLQSQLCLGDKGSGKYHCFLSLQLHTSSA